MEKGIRKKNHELALALKMLPEMAFEKEEIGNSYNQIVEEIQIVGDRPWNSRKT